jgi:hypothetical protein
MNISNFLQGLNAPLPFYRFNYMISKAVELTQDVNNFGSKFTPEPREARRGNAFAATVIAAAHRS